MKIIIAPNFCTQCGQDFEGKPEQEYCEVCQAAVDLNEMLNLGRRVRHRQEHPEVIVRPHQWSYANAGS